MKQHEKIIKELTDRTSRMLEERIPEVEKALHEAPDEPARLSVSITFKNKTDRETKATALICEVLCKATIASARDEIAANVSGGQLTLGF